MSNVDSPRELALGWTLRNRHAVQEKGRNVAEVGARQIAEDLRRRIEAGEFSPGDRLPSETELMAEYGMRSKNILKDARMLLEVAGLIVSEHGRGTFVRRFKRYLRRGTKRHLRSQRPAGTSPTQAETESQGIQRELNLLAVETLPAPADIAEHLRVTAGTPLVCRRHLITLDGDPAQTADSFFVADQVEGSRIARMEQIPGGVHAELASVLGTPLTHAEEVFVARMPTPTEKEALALLPGTPVVALARTIYAGGHPVEVTKFLFDGSWHRFAYDVPVD